MTPATEPIVDHACRTAFDEPFRKHRAVFSIDQSASHVGQHCQTEPVDEIVGPPEYDQVTKSIVVSRYA